jgi:hypothetical protein
MARFVVCALPGSGQVYINLDRVTFVRHQGGESCLVGFGEDLGKGITVAESAEEVLSGADVHDPT